MRKIIWKLKNPGAVTVVGAAFFASWLAVMVCITIKSALYYSDYYEEKSELYASAMSDGAETSSSAYGIWNRLARGNNRAYQVVTYGSSVILTTDTDINWQSAAAVYDGDGNLIDCSGNYLYLPYDTEEYWENADADTAMNQGGFTKVNVNFDYFDKSVFDNEDYSWERLLSRMYSSTVRLTGVFDGSIFHADKIECVLDDEFRLALYYLEADEHYFEDDGTEVIEYYSYSDSDVIASMDAPWHIVYDSGKETQGAVTIYSSYVGVSEYDEGEAIKYKGDKYDSLLSLLLSLGTTRNLDTDVSNLLNRKSSFNLLDTIIFEEVVIYDYENLVEIDIGLTPARKYIITTAVRCSPLGSAVSDLAVLYIVSFLVIAGIAVWVCGRVRQRLLDPVVTVSEELMRESSSYAATSPKANDYQEVKQLYRASADIQNRLLSGRIEISRLNTALDYAKTAEENRRQMTSNIAHELKTPLAVIHSYAEGIKEHIADDKRDKYLDVILSEAERMDAMVLEMLDLSRLEAGKVKLSRDSFLLSDLTRSIFSKLERAVEAKELHIEYKFNENGMVVADESRIGQVIENFATNAIKYTPAGGNVLVKIEGSRFAIENDCEPLSDEALGKVWDTFYRTDEARTKVGTGLGLAIAKSIIELHGGKCFVRNTETGVEFGFTI